jgi:hypothetical protein
MTLRDFICLSDVGKDETVEFKGIRLKEKLVPGYKVILYKVDNFFVEVYYDLKQQVVQRFKGCARSDLLYNG